MKVDIKDLQKVSIEENDVIIVRVDRDSMSPTKFSQHMSGIQQVLQEQFPDNKIMVMPSSMSIAIATEERAVIEKLK